MTKAWVTCATVGLYERAVRAALLCTAGEREKDRIIRHVMYERLATVIPQPRGSHRVLAISRSRSLAVRLKLHRKAEVVEADYPEHDLLNLKFADDSFDYLVADQVLEHVAGNPFQAATESLRVVKPGGCVVHTTCLINPIHGAPHDYWRFTPHALRLLFNDAEIIDVGGWGNRAVWWRHADLVERYEPVPKARWHPLRRVALRNEPDWPIVTWIVARKTT